MALLNREISHSNKNKAMVYISDNFFVQFVRGIIKKSSNILRSDLIEYGIIINY